MTLRQIFFIALVGYFLDASSAKTIHFEDNNESSLVASPRAYATSFDYDYIPVTPRKTNNRRRKNKTKAYTTTTERPLVRYWNTLMRNVRLPVPSLTWNMTNPFANIFNNGEANIIETPVGDYDVQKLNAYDDSDDRIGNYGNRRKKKQSRRRKNSRGNRDDLKKYKQKKHRQNVYPDYDDYDQPNVVLQSNLYYYTAYPQKYKGLRDGTQFVPYYYEDAEESNDDDDQIPPTIPTGNGEDDPNASIVEDSEPEVVSKEDEEVHMVDTAEVEDKQKPSVELDTPSQQENVRTALGSFMSDDAWNTRRQKANGQQEKPNKAKVTGKEWKPYRYFLLKSW